MGRKLIGWLLCFVMIGSMLAGCGSKGEATEENRKEEGTKEESPEGERSKAEGEKIVFWHWWSAQEEEYLKTIAENYQKETGVEVELLQVRDFATVLTAIGGGTPPDLLMMTDMSQAYELVDSGALMPLDDYMAKDQVDKDIFLDTAYESGVFDGTLYALPFMGFTDGLYWNKELFREAGLDPEKPPKTAEEMLEYAEKLTKLDENGNIIHLGYAPLWSGPHMAINAGCIKVFNGSVYDMATDKYTLTDPGIIKAFEWMREFNKELDPQKVANFVKSAGATLTAEDLFFSGKVAMHIGGCWEGAFMNNVVPDLEYGVAAIPASAENTEWKDGIVGIAYNPHCIPVGAANPDAAWDFMEYMIMNKEVVAGFSSVSANLSHLKDTDTEFTSELLESEYFKTFNELSKSSACYMFPRVPKLSEYDAKISSLFEEIMVRPEADIEALLEQAQNELNQ